MMGAPIVGSHADKAAPAYPHNHDRKLALVGVLDGVLAPSRDTPCR